MRFFYLISLGSCGILARYYTGIAAAKWLPDTFPFGTFSVNLLGSFLIGALYVLANQNLILPEDLRIGLIVGFLGGFTTFSSFALDTARLLERDDVWTAAIYFVGSPLAGLIAAFLGVFVGRWLGGTGWL